MARMTHRRAPVREQDLRKFQFIYTVREAATPEGLPKRKTATVFGLNQLDADVRLHQRERKAGNQIHAIVNVVAVAKTLNGLTKVI